MVKRMNKTLAKKGGNCPCSMRGGTYYKYNDLKNATPRDFLLSERAGGSCKVGGRKRTYRRRNKGKKTKKISRRRKTRNIKRRLRKSRRSRRKLQKGGLIGRNTVVPQDVVNLGRNSVHGVDSLSKSWRGIEHSASPLPTKDQLDWDNSKFIYKPISLTNIRADAENQVGKL